MARIVERRGRASQVVLAALVLVAASGRLGAQQEAKTNKPAPAPPPGAVALLGGKPISMSELEDFAQERLAPVKAQELQLKRQALDELITKLLLEQEAKAHGMSVAALEKAEIDQKILAVSEDQKRAVYESVPQNFQGKSEAEALALIESRLRTLRLAERRKKYLADLRNRAGVQVFLPAPVPVTPTTRVGAVAEDGGDPADGPKDAAVTLIEYSDFQCPYCQRAASVVKQLRQKYPTQLRVVFKDFPLNIHPDAVKSAEAGNCAFEQGRFWEFHDRLFQNQRALSVPQLKQVAVQLGLDSERFDTCLDSGKYEAEWKSDQAEGEKLGVRGTPGFVLNGRMFSGARPIEEFVKMIDEELAKKSVAGGIQ